MSGIMNKLGLDHAQDHTTSTSSTTSNPNMSTTTNTMSTTSNPSTDLNRGLMNNTNPSALNDSRSYPTHNTMNQAGWTDKSSTTQPMASSNIGNNALNQSSWSNNTSTTNPSMNSSLNTTAPYGTSNANIASRTGAAYTGQQSAATSSMSQQDYSQQSRLSGPDAMTRSEEQLRIAKAKVETGVAALDKTVSVEHVEKVIPVQRERVIIEREPITCTNLPQAMKGPEISEGHYETILHEDRIAAQKETVPIERIRLAKQVETSVQKVEGDLAREHIDLTVEDLNNNKIDPTSSSQYGSGSSSGLMNDKIDTRTTGTSSSYANDKLDTRSRSGLTNESRNSPLNNNISSRNV